MRITIFALVVALISTRAVAQDYVINVNGMVCEFCSIGVAKKVGGLSFIDREKYDNGVIVDIENQIVTIAVKKDASMEKSSLFSAIESGGYNPVAIWKLMPNGERVAQP